MVNNESGNEYDDDGTDNESDDDDGSDNDSDEDDDCNADDNDNGNNNRENKKTRIITAKRINPHVTVRCVVRETGAVTLLSTWQV